MDPRTNLFDLPMLKSPPIMGEVRHFLGVYYSYTAAEGTRASRDAKSEYWEGEGPLGKPRRRVGDINRKAERREESTSVREAIFYSG